MTSTTGAARLGGEDLIAARRVVAAQIVDGVEGIADEQDGLDVIFRLRELGRLVERMGKEDDPLIVDTRPDGAAVLDPHLVSVLVTAARWEDFCGDDDAVNRWDGGPGVEDARQRCRARSDDGRRVLSALGAERGHPAETEEASR